MQSTWPTRAEDLQIAQGIMEEYAQQKQVDALSLFELVVNQSAKRMDFKLANWVFDIAARFHAMYGIEQGEYVTRQVITSCIRQDEVVH